MDQVTHDAAKLEYYELVKDWAKDCQYSMSDASIQIAAKTLMHRDGVLDYKPGHFISALLNNDLHGVMSRADDDSLKHLIYIYRAWYNIDSYHIARKYKPVLFDV